MHFHLAENEEDEDDENFDYAAMPYYVDKIKSLTQASLSKLEIDCDHIIQYDNNLYKQLEMYPTEVLQMFDMVCTMIAKENARQDAITGVSDAMQTGEDNFEDDIMIQVCPFNLSKSYRIRDLTPVEIDKYISLKGIVIRNSDIIPEMLMACFKCTRCGFIVNNHIDRAKVIEPQVCLNQDCRQRGTYELCHERCQFSSKQYVKLQEMPESVPEGEAPQTMQVLAHDDMVDIVKPGDRVEVCGIFRAQGVRLNSERRTQKSIFRTYVDVVNFVKNDKKRFAVDVNKKNEEQEEDVVDQRDANDENVVYTE